MSNRAGEEQISPELNINFLNTLRGNYISLLNSSQEKGHVSSSFVANQLNSMKIHDGELEYYIRDREERKKFDSYSNKIPMEEDSTLIFHYNCKKCTPLPLVEWYSDMGTCFGTYMGRYATCDKCSERFHSDFENMDDELGYKKIRGKNCIKINA